jgi:hypothetical protein
MQQTRDQRCASTEPGRPSDHSLRTWHRRNAELRRLHRDRTTRAPQCTYTVHAQVRHGPKLAEQTTSVLWRRYEERISGGNKSSGNARRIEQAKHDQTGYSRPAACPACPSAPCRHNVRTSRTGLRTAAQRSRPHGFAGGREQPAIPARTGNDCATHTHD